MHKPAKLGANADVRIVGCSAPTMGEHDSQNTPLASSPCCRPNCCSLVVCVFAMDGLGYLEEEGVGPPAGGSPVLTAVRRL